MLRVLLLVLALFGVSVVRAEIYKWQDEAGNIHFTDEKPEGRKVLEEYIEVVEEAPVEDEVEEIAPPSVIIMKKQDKTAGQPEKSEKERICNQMRSNIIMDERISKVYTKTKDGSRRIMTPEERKKRLEEMKKELAEECG